MNFTLLHFLARTYTRIPPFDLYSCPCSMVCWVHDHVRTIRLALSLPLKKKENDNIVSLHGWVGVFRCHRRRRHHHMANSSCFSTCPVELATRFTHIILWQLSFQRKRIRHVLQMITITHLYNELFFSNGHIVRCIFIGFRVTLMPPKPTKTNHHIICINRSLTLLNMASLLWYNDRIPNEDHTLNFCPINTEWIDKYLYNTCIFCENVAFEKFAIN